MELSVLLTLILSGSGISVADLSALVPVVLSGVDPDVVVENMSSVDGLLSEKNIEAVNMRVLMSVDLFDHNSLLEVELMMIKLDLFVDLSLVSSDLVSVASLVEGLV